MSKRMAVALGAGMVAAGAVAGYWWFDAPMRDIPGVLLSVGPAAKSDPYAVAQGAVTHGEAVLIDFGDGDFAFFVNRSDDVLALINGCGEHAAPIRHERFPVLVDARFHTRNVPPYRVSTRSVHYEFRPVDSPCTSACP